MDADVETLCRNIKRPGGVATAPAAGTKIGHTISQRAQKMLEIYSLSPQASGSTCPEGAISSLNTSLKNVKDTKIIIKE